MLPIHHVPGPFGRDVPSSLGRDVLGPLGQDVPVALLGHGTHIVHSGRGVHGYWVEVYTNTGPGIHIHPYQAGSILFSPYLPLITAP